MLVEKAKFHSTTSYRIPLFEGSDKKPHHKKLEDVFEGDDNKAILDIVRQFQQNLNIVEQKIDANNQKRVIPYPYLKPSLILNSISI